MRFPVWVWLWMWAALLGFTSPPDALAEGLSSAVYLRTDSDDTLVVSPRAHLAKRLGEPTQIDVSYTADIWTSASIDIRASASRAVTEQRNELDVALSHEPGDLALRASYRVSVENDYESHGATASASFDFSEKSSTLALNTYGFKDVVGRAGDETFSRDLATLGSRASFTQVFDPNMLGQLNYELSHLWGYQASPYRFVGFGPSATGFGCFGAFQCFREEVPDLRTRHAMAVLLRRALSQHTSLGAEYRFCFDDWNQTSHTLATQFAWTIGTDTLLTLRYRYYVQSGVSFYSRIYNTRPVFATRDRELSPMQDHRMGLDLQQRTSVGEQGSRFIVNLALAGSRYSYANFAGLDRVYAVEATLALTLER